MQLLLVFQHAYCASEKDKLMADRPIIGVVASITNPLTTGYLAYLAFADSWSKVADEVVIVDGGSTDGSLEFFM